MPRSAWTLLDDAALLRQCDTDTYRASGPGGQKRNKTSSAVRLRHAPSGLLVIAEESRSQHENKAKALLRLRRAFVLDIREALAAEQLAPGALADHPDWAPARDADGRVHLRVKDPRFWPAVGVSLDALLALGGRASEAAAALGVGTANLVDWWQADPRAWQQVNVLRAACGQKPLRARD